jgi:hypothetical protein
METLYQHATAEMKRIIASMIQLSVLTKNFLVPPDSCWENNEWTEILLNGKGYALHEIPIKKSERSHAWIARSSIAFSIERAATGLLYQNIQPFINKLVSDAFLATQDFKKVQAGWINENPQYLPVLMHAIGAFSKRDLQKMIGTGTASDTGISKPVSARLAEIASKVNGNTIPNKQQITERIKSTTEGIVRDLVGRLLLEDFVAEALKREKVPFLREDEYEHITGVVYDFRADFVIPDPSAPKAFIEVRKSSSGHASLYAKDKMFSAINWKGKHKDCLAIVITEGSWTTTTLEIMSHVFDYVIPVERAPEAAKKIRQYLDGDKGVLRWLIQFNIAKNVSK